jgi:hypothetical protein
MVFPGALALATVVVLAGSVNDLLTKITATVFTQKYAFFVDQGANFLYAGFAAIPVLWAMIHERRGPLRDRLPEGLLRCPQRRFAFMGFLDAVGTFLSCIGAPGTPGHLQVVLNQTLILFTMVAAFAWLGTSHTVREVGCASLIFVGAVAAASGSTPTGKVDDGNGGAHVWSVVIFTLSNVPMALSNVYKELGFADQSLRLDVWSMTCTTTCYQILASFVLLPLQTLPYLSGDPLRGMSLEESWNSFLGGEACFFGRPDPDVECSVAGPLLTLYVLANLSFNFLSLCLTKLGSSTGVGSVLCSLAYAVKLPIANLLFAQRWLMGRHVESLNPMSVAGLIVVMLGFLGYLYYSGPGKGDAAAAAAADTRADPAAEVCPPPPQWDRGAHELPMESGTPYVLRDDHDETDGVDSSVWTLGSVNAQAIPGDAEPWAFHDRLIGCDASNSARLVSSKQLRRGLAELMCGGEGPEGSGRTDLHM